MPEKHKYIIQLELVILAESEKEAIQTGLNIAKNERSKFDNQCLFTKLFRLIGLMSKEVDLKEHEIYRLNK